MNSVNWVGHRGLPTQYPENTLEGLVAACEAGANGVELDVQLTKDCVPVVLHDESLLRTSGVDVNIGELTAEQVSGYCAGEPERFNQQFTTLRIPSLHSVAQALAAWPSVTVFVELKKEPLMRVSVQAYIDCIWRILQPIAAQCVIISYNLELLREVQKRRLCPVGWVLTHYDEASYQCVNTKAVDYLICNYKKLPLDFEDLNCAPVLWQGEWQWFVYDVVESTVMQQCIACGINWLETWDLKRAKSFPFCG